MATIVEESEDVFEGIKGRAISKVKEVLADTYAQDKADLRSDIAEALGLEEETDLPKFSIEVVLHIGKQAISVSGLEEIEDEDENEDDE